MENRRQRPVWLRCAECVIARAKSSSPITLTMAPNRDCSVCGATVRSNN